ncbi:uncharacterized protein LOC111621415 [Centruroides sculpturatus]|uniref:uncharacterized protein LOC111621415 n=1 Tax=Centruroides sculpturatus TaxID=218467 RepID=UPI000C6D9ECA|nr:uncharacterized protein LOC111621415 [Centruroides sculpturatus]
MKKIIVFCYLIAILLIIFTVDLESFRKCLINTRGYKYLNKVVNCRNLAQKIKIRTKFYAKYIIKKVKCLLPNIVCTPKGLKVTRPSWLTGDPWYKKIFNFNSMCATSVVECFCPKMKNKHFLEITKEIILEIWKNKMAPFINGTQNAFRSLFNQFKLMLGFEIELDVDKYENNVKLLMDSCHVRRDCRNENIKVAVFLKDRYLFYLKFSTFLFIFVLLVILHILLMAPEDIAEKDDESIYYSCLSTEFKN